MAKATVRVFRVHPGFKTGDQCEQLEPVSIEASTADGLRIEARRVLQSKHGAVVGISEGPEGLFAYVSSVKP